MKDGYSFSPVFAVLDCPDEKMP